ANGIPLGMNVPGPLPGAADADCDFGECGAGTDEFAGGGGDPTKQIQSLYEEILQHLEKLAEEPESLSVGKWQHEVQIWSRDILKKASKRQGDVDKYLQRTIGVSASDLENILGSPIIIVNPCIANPLAPYCSRWPRRGPA